MISIIIPTLNEEVYLPKLLASIKRQDFTDYEIIVSDGGSLDRTKEIALNEGCAFVVDNEHHHPGWQRNNGAAIAKGDILIFFDADTELQDGFLKIAVEEFISKKLGGAGFYIRFNPNKWSYNIYSSIFNFFSYFRQYFSPAAVGSGIIVRREINEIIKGFDTDIIIAEDFDYVRRVKLIGKFRMITSIPILFSSRRIKKDGEINLVCKWLYMSTYAMFNVKMKKEVVKYDFGKFQK